METWPMTEARAQLPTLLDNVRHGRWQLIGRRGKAEAVIAGAAEIDALLAAAFRFNPEVDLSGSGVGLWLPELELHATGDTLDDALIELADTMIEYAEDWEDHLRSALNHRARAGYVRRIQLAGNVAGIQSLLTRDAESAATGTASR